MKIGREKLIQIVTFAGLALSIPLFGNAFIEGWDWTWGDFAFAFLFLCSFGVTVVLVSQKLSLSKYRIPAVMLIIGIFALIWMELAVGVIENVVSFFL